MQLTVRKAKLLRASNGIFSKIGTKASPKVTLTFVRSYCLPVLLYGVEAITLNTKLINSMDNAYRSLFAKMFGSYDSKVILNCQYYCGNLPVSYVIDFRKFEFYKCLINNSNDSVRLLLMRTGACEFDQLSQKFNITSSDSLNKLKFISWSLFDSIVTS